jgi:hypothetical protein
VSVSCGPILCVSTKGTTEKKQHKCELLGNIYARAAQVLVWVGEESEDVKDVFQEIELASSIVSAVQRLFGPGLGIHSITSDCVAPAAFRPNLMSCTGKQLIPLLRREYFRRKWIIQEVVSARKALMVCGDKTLRWEKTRDAGRSTPRSWLHTPKRAASERYLCQDIGQQYRRNPGHQEALPKAYLEG